MVISADQLSKTKERLYWNVIRGIAIYLMLWGHCIQYCAMDSFSFFEDPAFKAIYSFHMPLFMLVSGYLYYGSFEKRDLRDLLTHRIQGVLWPIIGGTVINNLLMMVPTVILSNGWIPSPFDGALLQGWNYSLWFLWSVLSCSTAVGVACKVGKTPFLRIIYLSLGVLFVALFPNANENLFMYPFFIVGFFMAKHKQFLFTAFGRIRYIVFLLFPILLLFYKRKHYIYITPMFGAESGAAYNLTIDLFRFFIGLAGSLFLLILVSLVFRRFSCSDERIPKFWGILSRLGENSLPIYCLSVPLLSGYLPHVFRKCMEPFGYNLLAENWILYNLIFTPLLAAGYCAALLVVIRLLKKIGIHKLFFGR